MPQLDLFTFSSQIFWFIVIFWSLYLVLFSTFIYPFAFIIKVRSYLSMFFTGVVLKNVSGSKIEWESDNLKIFLDIMASISYLDHALSTNHDVDINSFNSLVETTFDSVHNDTDFLSFMYYYSPFTHFL